MNPALLLDPKGSRKQALLLPDVEQAMNGGHEYNSTPSPPQSYSQSSTSSIFAYNLSEKQFKGTTSYDQLVPFVGEAPRKDSMDQQTDESERELMNGDPATQNSDNGVTAQVQPAFDPRALLNPKAKPKRPASDTESDRGRDGEAGSGQISLVERLHNVHERTASPSKRVKTQDDQKKQPPKVEVLSSGALDLKPKDGEPNGQPQSASIDLTMSDDEEEVKVVKDNSKQIICIGRIKQCYIQSHVVPYPDPQKYHGNHGAQGRIKVNFRRGGVQRSTNVILVVDPTGREFGRVDMKTAQGLAPLMDCAKQNGLMWMAVTEPRRKQPGEGPPGSGLSALISLTLQLYCPRRVAHDIGKYLKSKNIFLADPVVELQKYDYFNPQTTSSFSTRDVTQPDFEANYGGSRYAPGTSYVLRSVEEIRSDVLNMFSNIVNSEDIPQREQSPLISTALLKHQKQALHFMTEKESEWTDDDASRKDSLYKASFRNDGRKHYIHVITGEEIRGNPQSIRGGILADEMGLGKTLSILSLVTDRDSMAAGKTFATKAPPMAGATRLQLANSRATLLICPLSTMVNWKQQIQDHFAVDAGFKWAFYHGPERKKFTVDTLADHDLIITTYQMISADAKDQAKPLLWINWFRIVLDEAHTIRSGKTQMAQAVYKLAGQRRWAVTGTPVQNRLEDLGALFKFLRVRPFDDANGFTQHILRPFKEADPDVVPKLQLLVSSITLRRLKDGNVDLPSKVDLVVRLKFSDDERRLHDWFEQDSARKVNAVTSGEKLGGGTYARILTAITHLRLICAHGRDLLNDEALKLTDGMTYDNPMDIEQEEERIPALSMKQAYDMLDILMQTDTDRCQFSYCRHSVTKNDEQDYDDDDDNEDSDDSSEEDSGTTGHSKKNDTFGFMTKCYHIICPRHIKKLPSEWNDNSAQGGNVVCPFCDDQVCPTLFELKRSDWKAYQEERERIKKDPKLSKKMGAYTGPHTKTKALLEELQKSKEESLANPSEPPIKSVIFSYWTTHLDLIQIALNSQGHKYTRLDGGMNRKARDRALVAFANDPNVPIILVSIGAGGLGLNLTTASKVYMMEPQFNPAAEAQAVDRVHRLGQKREVTILRFIMENSFEEKMLELQRKKKALADLTMAREKTSKEQAAKQRLEDLRSLFK